MKDHSYITTQLSQYIDDIKVEYFPTIGSTNDYFLEANLTHKYHFCYVDKQTKGRGRRGDKWISEGKDNIYSTLAFHCNFAITTDSLKSVKIALSVLAAIKKYIPKNLQQYLKIKLPNDIYFQDQKLAGILIETKNIKKDSFDILIGVGINVNMTNIDENIDREWTSLSSINNQQLNSSAVIVDLVKSIIFSFDTSDVAALSQLASYDYILDKKIIFNYADKSYQGIAKGISKDLKLKIIDENNNYFEFELANINKIRVIK
ncbi:MULTISPECIES: biotin--[acetyl-CoA-carboxylase] ligase [Francisella]|uniref:Biotin--[acetyl-CoA-carboxylase] ligase n=1 Tax=Francisella opportunistica TaxID=2016517 RepID=A0A345JSA0_9GAMM|nr:MULTISPECIES: biotin--[acetyl-CoA-carboxylase] ligase [Francisella]APC91960.1 Biotin-protein ligase / Biotin operon repressor [Francisella sp. MA067296]AXH30196.1 biotin--[acetyl-CoA-carboxylase] ligase [Francisella opportunistica]AXH31837.1 biotin--[acetyl-CoA-carboxylase] ligase [Francisella opportunistica]AXH33483.1 biotin--[acetyl-CoA-carboxylase] ligase [Francisella opportunistica]